MLIEADYPKFRCHRNQHQAFINTYEKLTEEYRINGASIQYSHLLNKSAVAWATQHIQSADVEFANYLRQKENLRQKEKTLENTLLDTCLWQE
jgi:hemerythrin